jgi:hypothetical protein
VSVFLGNLVQYRLIAQSDKCLSLSRRQAAIKGRKVVRRRGSHIFIVSRLTDGGEVVSLTRRPAVLYPQEDSWYSFVLEAESTPGP